MNRDQGNCYYCQAGVKTVDFKDTDSLLRFVSSFGKILPKRRTGVCSQHQRKVSRAIKTARIMGLIPFVNR